MKLFFKILFGLVLILTTSCSTLNKSRMLRTPKNFEYSQLTDSLNKVSYTVNVNDMIKIKIYSNNGYRFFSLSGQDNINSERTVDFSYKVRSDSTVKIPVIGSVKIVGFTLFELEEKFESILSPHINNPFVMVEIENKRVFLFRGGNSASVVNLPNEKTTLFEVLATAGGIDSKGNASRIKVIRGDPKEPQIYLIDLSTIKGMTESDFVLQSEDIIYVDPFLNYAALITSDIASISSLVSSLILIYTFTDNFK